MGLKRILENLEGVPDAQKALYVSDGAGKFKLDIEGEDPGVENLKGALSKERKARETAEKSLGAFKGLNPEQVATDLAHYAEIKDLDPVKEADKLAGEKIKVRERQIMEKAQAELKAATDRGLVYRTALEQKMIDAAAISAISEAKGSVDLLLPIVKGRTRVKEMDGGRFAVEVLDDEGNARIKDSTAAAMGIADYIQELKASPKYGRAFEGSGAGGSGATGNGGGNSPAGGRTITQDQVGQASLEELASGKVKVVG